MSSKGFFRIPPWSRGNPMGGVLWRHPHSTPTLGSNGRSAMERPASQPVSVWLSGQPASQPRSLASPASLNSTIGHPCTLGTPVAMHPYGTMGHPLTPLGTPLATQHPSVAARAAGTVRQHRWQSPGSCGAHFSRSPFAQISNKRVPAFIDQLAG